MILISGSSGFIGKNITKSLARKKILFKTVKTKSILKKKDIFFQQVSCFIHLGFDFQKEKKEIDTNVLTLKKILKLSKKYKFKIIFPSTCTYKYDKKRNVINRKIFAFNQYSLSKIKCENLLINHNKNNKSDVIILRIFNVYGVDQKSGWLIPDLIRKVLSKKSKNLKISNYLNTRDFIHISDVSSAMINSLSLKGLKILNIGTGKETQIIKVAKTILKELKSNKRIIYINKYSGNNSISRANISETKKILKWEPKVKINKGLKHIIKHEKNK